jgi:hypothetical protein
VVQLWGMVVGMGTYALCERREGKAEMIDVLILLSASGVRFYECHKEIDCECLRDMCHWVHD